MARGEILHCVSIFLVICFPIGVVVVNVIVALLNVVRVVLAFTVCVSVIDETLNGSAGFDNVTLLEAIVVMVNPEGSLTVELASGAFIP